jgi:hypothetical protein
MRYRPLGDSGLMVSVAGLGCNNFGGRLDLDATRAVVDAALEAGITLLDTADMYGNGGGSEELLGEVLAGRRDEVVLATKFGRRDRTTWKPLVMVMKPVLEHASWPYRSKLVGQRACVALGARRELIEIHTPCAPDNEARTIRRPGARHRRPIHSHHSHDLPRCLFPDLYRPFMACGGEGSEPGTAQSNRDRSHPVHMAGEGGGGLGARGYVPDPHLPVVVGGGKPGTARSNR